MAENRLGLNNFLQQRYGSSAANHLRWEFFNGGAQHETVWTCIAYSMCLVFFGLSFFSHFFWVCVVDDIEYGRGSGSDKGTAKEIAAGVALRQLQGQLANLSN